MITVTPLCVSQSSCGGPTATQSSLCLPTSASVRFKVSTTVLLTRTLTA
jgi:hypothetical protein